MASTIGLYLRMSQPEANAMRSRLNGIAKGFGYTAISGPTTGDGNLSALLQAIDVGEVALMLLPEGNRARVVRWLGEQAALAYGAAKDFGDLGLADALADIADALEKAEGRG